MCYYWIKTKQMNKYEAVIFFSSKCVCTIVAVPCTILAVILVTIVNTVQFVSLVRMVTRITASMVHGMATTNASIITMMHI